MAAPRSAAGKAARCRTRMQLGGHKACAQLITEVRGDMIVFATGAAGTLVVALRKNFLVCWTKQVGHSLGASRKTIIIVQYRNNVVVLRLKMHRRVVRGWQSGLMIFSCDEIPIDLQYQHFYSIWLAAVDALAIRLLQKP